MFKAETNVIRVDVPQSNGTIISKEAVEKMLKSIKKGTPIKDSDLKIVGQIVCEPRNILYDKEAHSIRYNIWYELNDAFLGGDIYVDLGASSIEAEVKNEH